MISQNGKRICLVYQEDYPWDIRIEKIGRALTAAGHHVSIVCRNEARLARREMLDGFAIRRLPAMPDRFGALNEIANFPAFFNPLWFSAISRCVKDERIELIIVRDLPLALTAVAVGKYHRVPVVMDMAECYPELLRSLWKFGRFRVQNVVVRNPYLAVLIEKAVIATLDHIWVVVEEARDRLVLKGARPEKISVVSNTSPRSKIEPLPALLQRNDGPALRLIYVGLLTKGRGLATVLKGVAEFVKANHTPISLGVIGTGESESEYRQLSADLGVEKVVEFKGWIDNTKIMYFIRSSNVGIVPHHVCGYWDHTIPNKLFDYMAGGVPILASNAKPVARIVRETGCGLIYRDFDSNSFRDCLVQLNDEAKRRNFGERGRKAVMDKYHWERDAKRMLDVIDRLTASRPNGSY